MTLTESYSPGAIHKAFCVEVRGVEVPQLKRYQNKIWPFFTLGFFRVNSLFFYKWGVFDFVAFAQKRPVTVLPRSDFRPVRVENQSPRPRLPDGQGCAAARNKSARNPC
jgi:hypothetical protein